MTANMRKVWGLPSHHRSGRGGRGASANEEQIKNLMEICGPELSRRGAKKLLADHRGDASTALNVFMDMSPDQRQRLKDMRGQSSDEEEADVGVVNAALPEGWTEFKPQIIGWIKAQCAALGCSVHLISADKSVLPAVIPLPVTSTFSRLAPLLAETRTATTHGLNALHESMHADAATPGKLSLPTSFPAQENVGRSHALDVLLRRGFVQTLIKREKKAAENSSAMKAVEGKLNQYKDLKGTIDWRDAHLWCRGGPASDEVDDVQKAATAIVAVATGASSSEGFLIPACMVACAREPGTALARFGANGESTKDAVVPHAVETACSKVVVFDRVGLTINSLWIRAITDTLQNKFVDTVIFSKPIEGGYRFAACGLGAPWVRHWLLGQLLWQIPEGHSRLRGDASEDLLRKTGCSILLGPEAYCPQAHTAKDTLAVWEWRSPSDGWRTYTPEETRVLEDAYASGQATTTMWIGDHTYLFNFNENTQMNVATNSTHPIRRVAEAPREGDADSPTAEAGRERGVRRMPREVRELLGRMGVEGADMGLLGMGAMRGGAFDSLDVGMRLADIAGNSDEWGDLVGMLGDGDGDADLARDGDPDELRLDGGAEEEDEEDDDEHLEEEDLLMLQEDPLVDGDLDDTDEAELMQAIALSQAEADAAAAAAAQVEAEAEAEAAAPPTPVDTPASPADMAPPPPAAVDLDEDEAALDDELAAALAMSVQAAAPPRHVDPAGDDADVAAALAAAADVGHAHEETTVTTDADMTHDDVDDDEEDEEDEDDDAALAAALAMSLAEAGGADAAPAVPPVAEEAAAAAPTATPPPPLPRLVPQPSQMSTAAVSPPPWDGDEPSPVAAATPAHPPPMPRPVVRPMETPSPLGSRAASPPPHYSHGSPRTGTGLPHREGRMWVAVVGPHNTRPTALSLIDDEREVREEILRILPSMQGCLSQDEIAARTRCKVVAFESPGMIRVVGRPEHLARARQALVKFVPAWQRAVQQKRLDNVTKDLVYQLSKIEVRVPISDRMRQLLSQPIGAHASLYTRKANANSMFLDRLGRRSDRRPSRQQNEAVPVQVMWVTLDEFAMTIMRKMEAHGVTVPKEWTPQGAALGVFVGDRIRNNAPFNTTPAARKAVDGLNAPAYEDGTILKLESWLNQDPLIQSQSLDVFLRSVDDWLKCTCEQRISDPGRPSLVAMEVEWSVPPAAVVRGHRGMWRQDGLTINNYWCSNPSHRDWPYCQHSSDITHPHWSCCGVRSQGAACTNPHPSKAIEDGSKVRVKASVKEPKFEWGRVRPGDVGTVVKMDPPNCYVEFPKCKKWKASLQDLELAPLDKQRGTMHNPALGYFSRLDAEDNYEQVADADDAAKKAARVTASLVQQKWSILADKYLLRELIKVLTSLVPKEEKPAVELRAAHATTQRARHRLKAMEKDAENMSSKCLDAAYQVMRGVKKLPQYTAATADGDAAVSTANDEVGERLRKIVALLTSCVETAQESLKEWLQEINTADFEVERQLTKLRDTITKRDHADRTKRTVWDILQHISEVTGTFIDYRPPNLHLRVSGNEVNIRAAMQHLRFLGDKGALGLEKTVTVAVDADVARRLRKNNSVLLQLIEQQAGLNEARLAEDNVLSLTGTGEQVTKALKFLDLEDRVSSDEYAMPLLSQATQSWGRQQSAIPLSDPKKCSACLMDENADDEPELLYELLCGHHVHPSCLRAWVTCCIERSLGITESGEMEGPGALAVCPMTGGGGCTHVLTTTEFCDAARLSTAGTTDGAHAMLNNLERQLHRRLPTHDRIRNCPRCGEWTVTGNRPVPLLCLACGHTFCAVKGMPRCGGTAHYFSSCDQFAKAKVAHLKRRSLPVPPDAQADSLMPDNCVPCRKCQSWIMREEEEQGGERCRYMVCRECMYEFCWFCLLPAVNHKHVHSEDTPQAQRSKPPECDPDNRDRRRTELLDKMQEGEVVGVWNECTSCSRCDKWPIARSETAYACLQCPNIYLCEACEPQGCPVEASHVLDDLPRVEPSVVKGKDKPPAPPTHDELAADEAFWNDILPSCAEWQCPECGHTCNADVCACGERRVKSRAENLCGAGHELTLSQYADGASKDGWRCASCAGRSSGERWFCPQCHDDICFACKPRPPAPSAVCPSGHNLHVLAPQQRAMCGGPGCGVRFPAEETKQWHCGHCDYSMCASCFRRPQLFPKKYFLSLIGVLSGR